MHWLARSKSWLHLLRTDNSPAGVLRRSLALLTVITVVTAWFSVTFFFPDEHFQILEFMAMKLGWTNPADLPWEYAAKARPFLQPFLYFLIAKPLTLLGLHDAFWVMFLLRLITGIFSIYVLIVFSHFLLEEFDEDGKRYAFARMLPFMGFLPYLFVRTASETAAAAFFTLAMVIAVRGARRNSWKALAIAGALCGAAFECRFQTAFLTLGLFSWLALQARIPSKLRDVFILGGLAIVAVSALIDRWGYGVWCFPPSSYFYVNLVQGVASRVFGTSPWFAYFYLEPGTIFAPITFVLMIAMVIAAIRNPRHIITWVTVPFFVAHCCVGHKEERFLFPLAILFTAYPVLAFAPGGLFPVFNRVWAWRKSWAAKFVGWSAVAAMLFLAVYPFGLRQHMKMAKYLYYNFPNGLHAWSFEEDRFHGYPMLLPKPYSIDVLPNQKVFQEQLKKGPVYLLSGYPGLPPQAKDAKYTLLYSEYPFATSPKAARDATKFLCDYADMKRKGPIHPPYLYFLTLYKLEQGKMQADAPIAPCIPAW